MVLKYMKIYNLIYGIYRIIYRIKIGGYLDSNVELKPDLSQCLDYLHFI